MNKPLVDRVTMETLSAHEPYLAVALNEEGYHATQIIKIIDRNRDLMREGLRHSQALSQAVEEAGAPALKREFFTDDTLPT